MKCTFNIDCTPDEARQFFGLPNVAPMQDRIMEEMEERMLEQIRSLDPETFVKTWMPATVQGWNELQKIFWGQMGVNPSSQSAASSAQKKRRRNE